MRPLSNNLKRAQETLIREDRIHERTGRFIICSIYTGLLPTGVKSPGFVPSVNKDRRAGIYVVPVSVLKDANLRGIIGGNIPADGPLQEADWARENVKLVIVDNQGLSGKEILKDYLVRVPFPFWTATSGILVPKPGQATSQAAVPDGDSIDDIKRKELIDKNIPILQRMKQAQVRYGITEEPVIGVPLDINQEQFPRDGDKWLK